LVQADFDSLVLKTGRLLEHGLSLVIVHIVRTVPEHKKLSVPVLGTDKMSQDGHFALNQFNSRSQGLQRPPVGEQDLGVAEQGEVGAFAGERHSQTPGVVQSVASQAGQLVQIGRVRGLKRGLAVKLRILPVSQTVQDDE
jgi:hypothetical protein